MITRLFTSALFAGIAAGLVAVLLQFWLVTPLLLEGEEYETGNKSHFAGVLMVEENAEGGLEAVPAPETDHDTAQEEDNGGNFTRHIMTFGVNMIVFTGFALVMVAGFGLAEAAGHTLTLRKGMIWGLMGFIVIQLAPAAGLFPELPGTTADDVVLRQYWWITAVLATCAGITLIAFGNSVLYGAIGAILIAIPHIIGAPHLPFYGGVAPPELAALFVARTLFVGMISWVSLGAVAGYFWNRQTA
jgi:cobalt transporter subunit CbtA